MPWKGEFHLTALRTSGMVHAMNASRRRPTPPFQAGMARYLGMHRGIARGLADLRVAACEEVRLRGDPLGVDLLCYRPQLCGRSLAIAFTPRSYLPCLADAEASREKIYQIDRAWCGHGISRQAY